MGDLVVERLEAALTRSGPSTGRWRVCHRQRRRNKRAVSGPRSRLYRPLALQQPVATDLRFVAASFKIITDLERIADLATNLAAYAQSADRRLAPEVDVDTIGREATRWSSAVSMPTA